MIVESLARMLAREHLHRPIKGKVITLGRQTVALTISEAVDLFRNEGITVLPERISAANKTAADTITRYGKKNANFIDDKAFFGLLGVDDIQSMDVSTYEGAEIIHNLNEPIPDAMVGNYDFVIDGGTFDHIFNVKTSFSNVTRMLKVGGRVFMWNASSNFTGAAYISMGPDFFRDYFLVNQYADCRAYVAEVYSMGQRSNWRLYEYLGAGKFEDGVDLFVSPFILMTLIMAEKGPEATDDLMPVQSYYRDDELWAPYSATIARVASSLRKPWIGDRSGIWRLPYEFAQMTARTAKLRLSAKHFRYIGRI